MKQKGKLFILVTCLAVSFLTGCGTKMYELTAEEEDLIAQYAAYTLAKHNIFQKDGIKAIDPTLLEDEVVSVPDTQEDTQAAQDPEADFSGANVGEDTFTGEMGDAVSLAESMGHEELSVSYTGFFLTGSYKEGKHYAVDAKPGNTFVVMQFTVENPTEQDVDIDMLAADKTYRACMDGTSWVDEDITLLLYDLSSYQGTVKAGESVELVLLFQTGEDTADQILDISLSVSSNDTINSIIL